MFQTDGSEKWDPLGPPHSYCMRQLQPYTVSHEKVKIFWKWCLHRWQIPLSLQMRLSKSKQSLSQRKKTNFPRIQPFLLPPFPQLLVHCQFSASFSSLWFSEKIMLAVCCCFPALVTVLLQHMLHPSFPWYHSSFSLLPLWLHPKFAISHSSRDTTSPYKTWLVHTSELLKLMAWRFFSSWWLQAKPILLVIQCQIYILPPPFSDLLLFFCDNLHLLYWDLL